MTSVTVKDMIRVLKEMDDDLIVMASKDGLKLSEFIKDCTPTYIDRRDYPGKNCGPDIDPDNDTEIKPFNLVKVCMIWVEESET